jgi:hypothetical protein
MWGTAMSVDSDVRLVPGQVVVDAPDLCLDSSDRRKPEGLSEFRRALVHDFGDGLTINWPGDYPGGVTINGDKVRVFGTLEITAATFPQVSATAPATKRGKATRGGADVTYMAVPHAAELLMTATIAEQYFGKGPIDVAAALAKLAVEIESLKKGKP